MSSDPSPDGQTNSEQVSSNVTWQVAQEQLSQLGPGLRCPLRSNVPAFAKSVWIKQSQSEVLLTLQTHSTHSVECGKEWRLHFIDLAADKEAVPQDVSHLVPECAD